MLKRADCQASTSVLPNRSFPFFALFIVSHAESHPPSSHLSPQEYSLFPFKAPPPPSSSP